MVSIAPSILSADFAELARAIDTVAPETDLLHVDVMDGHFVPNLTIGPPVVAAIRRHCGVYLDCHLMMTNPGEYLEAFARAGADGCSVHVEIGGTDELVKAMRDLGLDVGLAVNPDTPLDAYEDYLDRVDLVLLMTVFPGFGGQQFMAEVLPKIARTSEEIRRRQLPVRLEVDGGIDVATAPRAAQAGAEVFVAGSAIFGADDPAAAAGAIRRAAGGDGPHHWARHG
ncbi:MAG TPA: ribulose-phosphate 3-epimerase [Acidimicrobiales bacterium]|nr:ribulose-phosphate 3-epimerase [Acidimicrobiales bacterium]